MNIKNLIHTFVVLFVLLNRTIGQGDSIHRINSVFSKDTSSFEDLEFFERILKNKRIIFLGEATHQDALAIEAKVRITKYLHEKLDYDVLLLENGFTEMDRMWRDIKEGKDSVTGAFCWFSPNWVTYYIRTPYQNLAYYIDSYLNTENELFFGGIDVIEGTIYSNAFEPELEALLAKHCESFFEKPIYDDFKKFTRKGEMEMVDYTNKGLKKRFEGLNIEDFRTWAKNLDTFIDSLLEHKILKLEEKKELKFFQQGIISRLGFLEWNLCHKLKKNKKEVNYSAYTKIRDEYMAKNLLWYIDEFFPDKKIIVSASSLHLSRYLNQIEGAENQMRDLVTAGEITYEKHKDEIYSIAFINYGGAGGFFEADTVSVRYSEKPSNSLESYLHNKGENYCFLDLNEAKNEIPLCKEKYYMQPTFAKPHIANWEQMYDGIFYIDKMTPMKTAAYINRIDKQQPYNSHPDWYSKKKNNKKKGE